jgi:hypothetical protein
MFRRELLMVGTLAMAIFVLMAAAGWWTVRELHESSRMLVVDTLPGMTDAGLANERMNDNRRIMRDIFSANTTAERAQIIEQIKTNSTQALWRDYASSIYEPADLHNYRIMMLARSNYLQSCEKFFDLVSSGKMDEASAFYNGELGRSFQRCNDAAKNLFNYNVQQGQARAQKILASFQYAPLAMAGLVVLIYGLGLILGMRSALSGPTKSKKDKLKI